MNEKPAEKKVTYVSMDKMQLCGLMGIPKRPRALAIMMHGIVQDKNEWGNFYVYIANRLREEEISTFRFDFRGHGESQGSSMDVSIIGDVLDVKASIDLVCKNWNDKLILIATSFGAGPALLTAAQMQSKIKLIVLIAPVLDYEATFLTPKTEWASAYFNEKALKQLPEKGYLAFEEGYKLSPKLIEEFRLIKPYETLRILRVPIMIIHGDQDSMVPFEISKKFAASVPNLKLITLLGADHGFVDAEDESGKSPKSLENKEKMCREIIKFIGESY